jgi:hypothetical protein
LPPTQFNHTQQWELFDAAKLLEMRFIKLMQNGNGNYVRVKKSFTYMEEERWGFMLMFLHCQSRQ